ncbi:MAG TPA: phosphatase PAP2 family protein [Rhodopila sp.]|nr:phosphatase PAP2 family protein [Rhodopila sp.]
MSLAVGFAALFAVALLLRVNPVAFDYPLARAVNQLALGSEAAGRLAVAVTYPAVQGVAIVSLAWGCWFSRTDPVWRGRIVRGAAAAIVASVLAHFVQDLLPPLVKPIFDSRLHIRAPGALGDIDVLRATSNPGSSSFPSERATLYAGLAIAIFAASRGIGLIALGCTAGVEAARIYLGLHEPSDILGSFFLAATAVWLVEAATRRAFGGLVMNWERRSPAAFYGAAFAASYGLATAFEDLRALAALLLHAA